MRAAGVCVLGLGLAVASLLFAAAVHHPPQSHPSLTRCAASDAPSSYAPHPRSRGRTYGAPVQRPIVAKHGKRRARAGGRRANAVHSDRRSG